MKQFNRMMPGPRISREMKTVRAMIGIHCRDHHGKKGYLCDECVHLWDYARGRLTLCRFGEEKTTCVNCPVHCYKPDMKEAVRRVMRYAGPRMLWEHPILAIRHLIDNHRKSV